MARAALPCDGLLTSGVRKGRDVLAESLMALAALAGNTVVTAATTDAWEAARRGFARLLGRGDPQRTAVAERRLGQTHEQLTGVTGADLESAQAALEAQWVTRLADLLEEDPGIEDDLRGLVQDIRTALPPGVVSAAGHAVGRIAAGCRAASAFGATVDGGSSPIRLLSAAVAPFYLRLITFRTSCCKNCLPEKIASPAEAVNAKMQATHRGASGDPAACSGASTKPSPSSRATMPLW